jgi:hypothetical protein
MMAERKWYRLPLIFGLITLVGCLAAFFFPWDTEEYAVYEATVREAFSGDDVSYYVILNTTQPMGRIGISSFHSNRLGLPLSARASYSAKNLFRFHIPPKFRLPHPFTMVDQKDLDAVYAPSHVESRKVDELNGLLRGSWGVITLSRVGFDRSGRHAVVYAQLTYCGLCGGGTYLYLSKETGAWHIIGRAGTWIS